MEVFSFLSVFLCQRNWETSHPRTAIDDGDQLFAGPCLTIRCLSEKTGSYSREGSSLANHTFSRDPEVLGSSSSSGILLENWAGNRVGEPEKHWDQPILQPGFHQNLHWNQHNSIENIKSKELTVSDRILFFLTSVMYSFVKKRLPGD